MKKLICVLLGIFLLGSCADSSQIVRQKSDTSTKINPKKLIYISVPSDGAYGKETYFGSGQNTAQIILSAIAKFSHSVKIGQKAQSYEEALSNSAISGATYLVFPTILNWEDRATEWSAIPDKVEIKIEIVEVSTEKSIASVIISGKSGVATLGGDHPQDLLPKPIEKFISTVF